MTAVSPPVVEATSEQAAALAVVISESFHDLAVNRWLIPDPEERRAIEPLRLGLLVRHGLRYGAVHTTPDLAAAAVWLPCTGSGQPPPIDDLEQQIRAICGAHAPRCLSFEAALAAHHPERPHCHLALLGVLPQHQHQGLGSALVRHQHRRLDARRIPAYLEASSPDSSRWYLRHGYRPSGEPYPVGPGAPVMYPMWRDPG